MTADISAARDRMIDEQLRARGIRDERVLQAMRKVPRHCFVAPEQQSQAYDDCALPIHCSQTISQPYIVALMSEALQLSPGMRVLEIGAGSGYQAAVLAALGAAVYTVERHPALAKIAAENLNLAGVRNVAVLVGDGRLGWPDHAPFDRLIITAATDEIPPAAWAQLQEDGLMVVPLGGVAEQTLNAIRKVNGKPERTSLIPCRFVPLLAEIAAD